MFLQPLVFTKVSSRYPNAPSPILTFHTFLLNIFFVVYLSRDEGRRRKEVLVGGGWSQRRRRRSLDASRPNGDAKGFVDHEASDAHHGGAAVVELDGAFL